MVDGLCHSSPNWLIPFYGEGFRLRVPYRLRERGGLLFYMECDGSLVQIKLSEWLDFLELGLEGVA
jgi:hypothetical protein